MTQKIDWGRALAWRMRRQLLEPIGRASVAEVVGRVCGIQAQVASSAALAVAVRRAGSHPHDVARSAEDGAIVKTWAMHGALHLLSPREGAAFLALMADGRPWERSGWQKHLGMTARRWDALRDAVREALDGTVMTREELAAEITARPELADLDVALRSGWGTIFKPLAWRGELCFGPSQGGRPTFMRPHDASPGWTGLPDPDEALPVAVEAYFGAFGPATIEAFARWLAGGWFGTRRLRASVAALGDRLTEVDVDGERRFLLAEHVDELIATAPTTTVRLLPGFDQYVLGPGSGDATVIPPGRRAAVSRQAGWISPIVVSGGVVRGTWEQDGDRLRVAWFREGGRIPRKAIEAEIAWLAAILARDLDGSIELA